MGTEAQSLHDDTTPLLELSDADLAQATGGVLVAMTDRGDLVAMTDRGD